MIAIDGIVVTDAMREAGDEIASHLMTACTREALGNSRVGGCLPFDVLDYPTKYRKLITKYIEGDIDSVTAIYLAMAVEAP
jgi:hypothetical protein